MKSKGQIAFFLPFAPTGKLIKFSYFFEVFMVIGVGLSTVTFVRL